MAGVGGWVKYLVGIGGLLIILENLGGVGKMFLNVHMGWSQKSVVIFYLTNAR